MGKTQYRRTGLCIRVSPAQLSIAWFCMNQKRQISTSEADLPDILDDVQEIIFNRVREKTLNNFIF